MKSYLSLLMLNLLLWIYDICNELLLGNATLARVLTCCKKLQVIRRQENHGLTNSPWGGGR